MTSRHRIASWTVLATLFSAVPHIAMAQDEALTLGVAAMQRHDNGTARNYFEQALRQRPDSYEANWRLGLVLVEIGQLTPDDVQSPPRDSLYALAESYARRAVAAKPAGADGHFVLGTAVGRTSLTLSTKERIKRAAEIFAEAHTALTLDPRHDGAYHLLGRWHAEIMRLSSLQEFFARNLLGAAIFEQASWDAAEQNLRIAVEYAPNRIFHRLDLAEILADRAKWQDARLQVDSIALMPPQEPMDVIYRRQARALGLRLAAKLRP